MNAPGGLTPLWNAALPNRIDLVVYNGYLGLGASLSDSVLAQRDLLGASSRTPLCERRKLEQTEGWLTVVMSE